MNSEARTPEASFPERAVRAAALLLCAASLVLCAWAELWFVPVEQSIGFDEGYIGALALRLIDGHMLPGVDGVGQRGPVFYWVTTSFQYVFGAYHWRGLRYLAWLCASAVVLALMGLGWIAKRPTAGALAGAFYVYICFHVYAHGSGTAMNGEQLAAPLLCWATLALWLALDTERTRRSRRRWAFASGLFLALAGWTKIPFLAAIAPLSVFFLVLGPSEGAERLGKRLASLAPLVAGWLAPSVFVLAVYGLASQLDELVYRFFTYNGRVYMGPYDNPKIWRELGQWLTGNEKYSAFMWLACTCVLLMYAGYLFAMWRRRELKSAFAASALLAMTLTQATLTFGAGIAQLRFWNHHFVAGVPWAGLLLGLLFDSTLRGSRAKLSAWLLVGVTLLAAFVMIKGVGADMLDLQAQRKAGGWRPSREDPLCREIQRHTRPEDYLFIWGFDGDLHVSCARKPASRYVYTTLVAGIVPPFWREARPQRVARGAPEQTLEDLTRTKPVLILDMPSKLAGVKVTSVPGMKALLAREYCSLGETVGLYGRKATFYGRRDRVACPAASTRERSRSAAARARSGKRNEGDVAGKQNEGIAADKQNEAGPAGKQNEAGPAGKQNEGAASEK